MPSSLPRLLAAVVLAGLRPACAQWYSVENITAIGGPYTSGTAINNSGDVVGSARFSNFGHGFEFSGGTALVDLSILQTGLVSQATAINDSGLVGGN
ncbi:MAG TPA: hypothetical protein VGG37_00450, partial [Opitutaceae bacterium]